MKPLLLTSWDSALKTSERKLVLLHQDTGKRTEWLPRDFPFDSIIVENLGGFLTFPALRWLATNGVSLTALDFNGSVMGEFLPDTSPNVSRRMAQIRAFSDQSVRLRIATRIVSEKVEAHRAHLRKLHKLIKPVLGYAPRNITDLLALEAQHAEGYWESLGVRRDYPHARDPVNAALNYAFGLLESRARIAAHRAGLIPEIGMLHEAQDGKVALCYDLMEPFRPVAVQASFDVARTLKARDCGGVFGHGLRLRPEAAHRLVSAFSTAFDDKEMDRFTSRLSSQFP